MCIMCRTVLAHPSGMGTSSMHDNNRSSACLKSRKINGYDGRAASPLGIDILTLFQKGTKTGNWSRIIDLATPAGFKQHDFNEYFPKAFLATNLAFNFSNNLAFPSCLQVPSSGSRNSQPNDINPGFEMAGEVYGG